MARVELTNNELLALRDDINLWANQSPAYRFFMINKITMFFKQNSFQLKVLDSRLKQMVEDYAVHDESGKPVLVLKEDGKHHYTFVDEATEKKYIEEKTEYLNRSNYVEV